eukprot:CAMPEP_0175324572 /NCGR_PEP_ID=MMETSP0093-20121207/73557_1 /TAXON_ID=311494 /ORGANISM="Alexandrium monilatum, Strain CCMP3105" /LENGTH=60 /DNA_ID=CAMNT_0016621491 /DNA_START=15 /DNA_END=194 /DNA_ORIENTATION=-
MSNCPTTLAPSFHYQGQASSEHDDACKPAGMGPVEPRSSTQVRARTHGRARTRRRSLKHF